MCYEQLQQIQEEEGGVLVHGEKASASFDICHLWSALEEVFFLKIF